MAAEPDNNTLDNAGPGGRALADTLTAKVQGIVEGMPAGATHASPSEQQAAIARIVANNLYDYADELER